MKSRIAVVAVLAAGIGIAGCSSNGSGASKDVTITGCTRDAGSGQAVANGEVKNGTSKQSNYAIKIDVKANDSKLQSGFASVLRVGSGDTKTFTIRAVGPDIPSGTKLTCTITDVGPDRYSVGSMRITTALDVGVLLRIAVLSSGISGFVSGK